MSKDQDSDFSGINTCNDEVFWSVGYVNFSCVLYYLID